MYFNGIFPKTDLILRTFAYFEKPLYFLYKKDESTVFVLLYKLDSTVEEWITCSINDDTIEKLFNTRISLLELIKNSEKIILVQTKNNHVINCLDTKYDLLDKKYLPNKDAYVKNDTLFDIKIDIDGEEVEKLVLRQLSEENEQLIVSMKKNQMADAYFKTPKGLGYVEIKYVKFIKNVPIGKAAQHMLSVYKDIKSKDQTIAKLLYIIVIKNEDVMTLNSLKDKFLHYFSAADEYFLDIELRLYSIYDLIEQRKKYFKISSEE